MIGRISAPALTLSAALRDRESTTAHYREAAVRQLASALLAELELAPPVLAAAERHPRGAEVRDALLETARSSDPNLRGWALVGLGQLGARELLQQVPNDFHASPEQVDEGEQFVRQCMVIALSLLGTAANDDTSTLRDEVLARLQSALESPAPDLRFQAAVALVEVEGDDARERLVRALRREGNPQVRLHLFEALGDIGTLDDAALALLREAVTDPEEGPSEAGYMAALALAGARRHEAGPRLLAALHHRGERDRALEALAVLADAAPPEAVERVHALVRSPWTPGVTRVRAAYALARLISPRTREASNLGLAWLRRLAWHPRAAVREAVRDAQAALRQLGTRA